jgi:hypothetical protein
VSRVRIEAKVRKNPCFEVITEELNRLDLTWTLEPASGKGHPIMLIEVNGKTYRRPIACTPTKNIPSSAALGSLRRWLRERAFYV